MSDSSDEEEERELQRRRAAQQSSQQRSGSSRKSNLNEALAKALSGGFPGDTQCDIVVTAEELKREEDEKEGKEGKDESSNSNKEKDVAMDLAEDRTRDTLSLIKSESKVEEEGHAMSRQEDEEIDSDDDMEAYRIQQAMAVTDMKALDSVGQFSSISSFHFYLICPVLVDI